MLGYLFKNRKQKKSKSWDTKYPIFEKRVNKLRQTIKYTKSISTLMKSFENIKHEFEYIMESKPSGLDIEFSNIIINDINQIDSIRDVYIKDFINDRIDLELMKEKEVTQPFLKAGLVKKALLVAVNSIEYFPKDVELKLRIGELENLLLDCYKGVMGDE